MEGKMQKVNNTQPNEDNPNKKEIKPLEKYEQIIGLVLSLLIFCLAVYFVMNPTYHYTIIEKNSTDNKSEIVEKSNSTETTTSVSDQSPVIIALFTAGIVVALFSLNGLRFAKLSFNGASVEMVNKGSGESKPEKSDTNGKPKDETLQKENEILNENTTQKENEILTDETVQDENEIPMNETKETENDTRESRQPLTPELIDIQDHTIFLDQLFDLNEKNGNKFEKLSWFEKKIMRTLWKYQKVIDGTGLQKRWTFVLYNNHPEYSSFLIAIGSLLVKRYIYLDQKNNQYALTDYGIQLMNTVHADELTDIDYYPFLVTP
jgi:hypothetical protein